MIRKQNFKLNWKYALGELTLIFLGISLAIWFNNWNDKRKRDRLEREVIIQIYSDIASNKQDIDGDFEQLQWGLQSHVNIETYFKEDRPYADSMCFDFHWLKQDEYTFPVKGGYEALKTLGLDLIKNDTIRYNAQFVYEFGYPRISRETPFHPDLDQYFTDYYQQHFVPNEDTALVFNREWVGGSMTFPFWSDLGGVRDQVHIGYVPKDYEGLKNDPEFKVLMRQAKEYRRYKIRQYGNVQQITEYLMKVIERELDQEPLEGL